MSPCNNFTITSVTQDDTLIIHFRSNDLLKLNRKIQCPSERLWVSVNGSTHNCTGLEYGQLYEIFIEMQDNNGNSTTCFIHGITELQLPTLTHLNVTGDRVHLIVTPPKGSFDFFTIQCSNNQSYNSSINETMSVDCFFVPNLPLMSFVLETIKSGFPSATKNIIQEIPLPVQFTHELDGLLLTVTAEPPPPINLNSTYEFRLIFYPKNNENISYEREKVINLNPRFIKIFQYGLIPNLKHTIILTHTVNSLGYAVKNSSVIPTSNISYPFNVTNIHIHEYFNNIIITWIDPHSPFDPVEFIVLCNSNTNVTKKVDRNTTYICQQMSFNETKSISVQTHVAIPGYIHDRIAVVEIDVRQVPEIPIFEVKNQTENSIIIGWNFSSIISTSNLYKYQIKCNSDNMFISIDIQSNEYQCQSLVSGTLHMITMVVFNNNHTIQRAKSIEANTLLQKCQYKNHFYSPNINGTHSIIMEWIPPNGNFDSVRVDCPSSSITFQPYQLMPMMSINCIVTSGIQFNVTFSTSKTDYKMAIFQFTDTAPVDPFITTSTQTSNTAIIIITTTTTATKTTTTTTATKTTTTTTTESTSNNVTICSGDELFKSNINLIRWRIAAIIGFIIAGFLFLTIICLAIISIFLRSRN